MDKDTIKKLAAAGIGAIALIVIVVNVVGGGGGADLADYADDITIRCEQTGEEWVVVRGRLEDALQSRGYPIDPEVGMYSEASGANTGFPTDRGLWRRIVSGLNEKLEVLETRDRDRDRDGG